MTLTGRHADHHRGCAITAGHNVCTCALFEDHPHDESWRP